MSVRKCIPVYHLRLPTAWHVLQYGFTPSMTWWTRLCLFRWRILWRFLLAWLQSTRFLRLDSSSPLFSTRRWSCILVILVKIILDGTWWQSYNIYRYTTYLLCPVLFTTSKCMYWTTVTSEWVCVRQRVRVRVYLRNISHRQAKENDTNNHKWRISITLFV